jgi:hypothetical protein
VANDGIGADLSFLHEKVEIHQIALALAGARFYE